MVAEQEDVFYYLTLMNENYHHPAMPEGAVDGHSAGDVPAAGGSVGTAKKVPRVQLLGSGTILHEVLAAAELLESDFGVAADVWSVTSFTELRRDGIEVERWNMLHPSRSRAQAYVTEQPRGGAARWSRRPTTCGRSPTRSASGCRAVPRAGDRRLRPQRLAARCAGSSRSTATTSRWPR